MLKYTGRRLRELFSRTSSQRRSPEPFPTPLEVSTRTITVQTTISCNYLEGDEAASRFAGWSFAHELEYWPWTEDDVWCRAENYFAVAFELRMPTRNTFLMTLKHASGVCMQHDKGVRAVPKQWRKPTVHQFNRSTENDPALGGKSDAA